MLLLIKNAPGNKPLQLIFCYFWQTNGLIRAFLLTLLYPLPICVLFYYLNNIFQLFLTNTYYVTLIKEIILVGIRCSVVSYLLRYCLHFSNKKINWVTYIGSVIVGVLLKFFASSASVTYFYILLYLIGISMSYFKNKEERDKEEVVKEK